MAKKLFKHRIITAIIALAINGYTWLVFKLCRIELIFNPNARALLQNKSPCILTFWHSRILLFPKLISQFNDFHAVVSTDSDAEYLASILKLHGHHLIRGSSRKNSLSAMMGIIKQINQGKSIAITPDGPKGPRFQIKGSVVQISKKYNLPIIPATYSASHAIVFKSWDRFILPIPLISKIRIDIGAPLYAKDIDNNEALAALMLKQVIAADKWVNLKIDYK